MIGVLSEIDSVAAALGRKALDAGHRAAELELSYAPEKIAAQDHLFFKERCDARSDD